MRLLSSGPSATGSQKITLPTSVSASSGPHCDEFCLTRTLRVTQFCRSGLAPAMTSKARCDMPDAEESAEEGLQGDLGPALSPLLDAPNRAIIEALQRDGRQPYGAIAQEVGLSEAAVRRRVQRLREAGIMQIVAVTDPLQLGFTRQAMIGITVEGDVRTVADKLSARPEVDY